MALCAKQGKGQQQLSKHERKNGQSAALQQHWQRKCGVGCAGVVL
jgi:hypothetical protein